MKNNEKKTYGQHVKKKKRSRIASLADLRLRDLGVLERSLVAAAVGRDGADGALAPALETTLTPRSRGSRP